MGAWWTADASYWFLPLALSGPLVAPLAWCARRGLYRQAVMRTWIAVIVMYGVVTAAGVVAVLIHQPDHVWRPLVYAGFFTVVPYSATYAVIRNAYVQTELRKTLARDL